MGARLSLLMTLILAGCGGTPTGPSAPTPFRPGDGTQRPRSGSPSPLHGEWTATLVVQLPADLQTTTIVWRFAADGSCRRTVTTESLVEGFPRTTVTECTYVADGAEVDVTYAGATEPVSFPYSLVAFSRDRLLLDGIEYQRVV